VAYVPGGVVVMFEHGLTDFELDIRPYMSEFRYFLMFRLASVRGVFTDDGIYPSPTQCFNAAMSFLSQTKRKYEAV
jgi:hypothetical protein